MIKFFIISFLALLVLNGLIFFYFSHSISKDISIITENLHKIALGEYVDFDKRIPVVSNDEIGDLVVAFNRIQELFKIDFTKIKETEESKRKFINTIAHELKTPLSIAIGNLEILQEYNAQKNNHANQSHLDSIKSSVLQLALHIDRIITFSMKDDEEYKPILDLYNYPNIIKHIVSQFKSNAIHEQKTLNYTIPDQKLIIKADIILIEEIIRNLIQNAFKFTSQNDTINISVKGTEKKLITTISDTGCGIKKEKLKHIFNRFYQADDLLSRSHGGTGLGLYICKRNIELHQGTINVESTPQKGTTFTFELPLQTEIQNAAESKKEEKKLTKTRNYEYAKLMNVQELSNIVHTDFISTYENNSPDKAGILIVEDNQGMMKVIVEALHQDYNLFIAKKGTIALQKLENNHTSICLILSDIMMP